ncbi:GH22043 [Drosophila grimshawi]|uniref:GH22043 n=1 Tax=Drosophila grimshawi TaxID=7222 RepID=B4JS66_DROGR|nr:GH22043 [Drosophila grimshawi]
MGREWTDADADDDADADADADIEIRRKRLRLHSPPTALQVLASSSSQWETGSVTPTASIVGQLLASAAKQRAEQNLFLR